jgi:catechol 2,3-dioxygenase
MGHLHLHVGDIDRGLAFYRDVIGFEPQARMPSAAFVSAGGYHHHLAFNTWRGVGVPPAPEHRAGLRHWTLQLPADARDDVRERVEAAGAPVETLEDGFLVRDPWGTALVVTAALPIAA